jgi:hypothetical protein
MWLIHGREQGRALKKQHHEKRRLKVTHRETDGMVEEHSILHTGHGPLPTSLAGVGPKNQKVANSGTPLLDLVGYQ